jgi:hypothetical protein
MNKKQSRRRRQRINEAKRERKKLKRESILEAKRVELPRFLGVLLEVAERKKEEEYND